MDTLYTFGDNIQYKTKSVNFLGLMNSATKVPFCPFPFRVPLIKTEK